MSFLGKLKKKMSESSVVQEYQKERRLSKAEKQAYREHYRQARAKENIKSAITSARLRAKKEAKAKYFPKKTKPRTYRTDVMQTNDIFGSAFRKPVKRKKKKRNLLEMDFM